MFRKSNGTCRARRWRGALATALIFFTAGCAQLGGWLSPDAPYVSEEWAELLQETRAYERRIGFVETNNFTDLTKDFEAFYFCGVASRLVLPYSYQDPAITWTVPESEVECRALGKNADVYYGESEALGEVGTPVTPAMIANKLDRFLYLIIHEDCHDQFDLPAGIEEALCDIVTYKGMTEFTRAKYGVISTENRAIARYADRQSRITRATVAHYTQLELLYARHARGEISDDAMLSDRAGIFKAAEKSIGNLRELNNVVLANDMTYSRHYSFLEIVFDALDRDLPRTITFFRHIDKIKPEAKAVIKQQRLKPGSVDFLRAYEAAVAETIRNALPEEIKARGEAKR
jgi:hypothetical protein